jgi:isochorismate pyruvate lyase
MAEQAAKLDSGGTVRHSPRMTRAAEHCTTMTEVREGVDRLDRELIALLRRRFDYMDAAARIKPTRAAVRDEERKTQVIANARAAAEAAGLPGDAIADLWDRLVEASIAYELARFDARA